jgi:hypothetical protein
MLTQEVRKRGTNGKGRRKRRLPMGFALVFVSVLFVSPLAQDATTQRAGYHPSNTIAMSQSTTGLSLWLMRIDSKKRRQRAVMSCTSRRAYTTRGECRERAISAQTPSFGFSSLPRKLNGMQAAGKREAKQGRDAKLQMAWGREGNQSRGSTCMCEHIICVNPI